MKIYILESLRINDPKTGEMIHNDLTHKGFNNEFNLFKTKKKLFSILTKIKNDILKNNSQPVIHFDCHGDNEGICVINGKNEVLITWEELRIKFRELQIASGSRTVICMSSCEGLNVAKLVAAKEPCPYEFVCGSMEEIRFDLSLNAYIKYYDSIFSGKSFFDSAVDVSNMDDFKELKFIGVSSSKLFDLAVKGYIEFNCTPTLLASRKQKIINQLLSENKLNDEKRKIIDEEYTLEAQKSKIMQYSSVFFS